jgi:hypothetical protein
VIPGLQSLDPDPILTPHCEEGWRLHQPANCGKVVSTRVGCGRFDGKKSRVAPSLLAKKESLMTALTLNIDHGSLLTRRRIIGAAASLICMPAIVRVANLMPVRRLPCPYGPQYAGFVERLYLHSLEGSLKACLRAGRTIVEVGAHKIPLESAQQTVAFAQAHGFLAPYVCIYQSN